MKRPIDLIMFDLDGTLADTGPDLADSVNYTRSRFELSPLPQQLIYTHVGRGVEYLLRHAVAEEAPCHFAEIMRVFLEYYQQHLLDKTVLYPHVIEVLDYFGAKRNAVVTNKLHNLAVTVLRGLGIEERFDAVLGGDSGAEKKPDPALLRLVLRQFQIIPANALMVGDGDTDIEAGRCAGVITCGVTYGLANKDDLAAAKPDFLIDDLAQLTRDFC
ncbi:MAG TPA: HAD-IA family hydrolase [Candidatus Binatia bacterium]|nr:HAD-IA family hydrolase [Candidatus Binatia bacterium]